MLRLVSPDSPELWLEARRLVQAYAASLDIDLGFQDFAHELATLSDHYGPPAGCFVLASWSGRLVACGGVRPFKDSACEMKRLYVTPDHRGKGIGQAIATALIDRARELGYKEILLDTLSSMQDALRLYARLGFAAAAPYRHNPLPGATFLVLRL